MTFITGLDKQKKNQRKIVNIFLPISFNICFGCSKKPVSLRRFFKVPTTYVLVEIRKLNFPYALLTMSCFYVFEYYTTLKTLYEPGRVICNNVAFLTSIDSEKPVQPPFKLRNSK